MNRSVMVLQGSLQKDEEGKRYLRVKAPTNPDSIDFLAKSDLSLTDLAGDLDTNREYEIKIVFKPVECSECYRQEGHNSKCSQNDANKRLDRELAVKEGELILAAKGF